MGKQKRILALSDLHCGHRTGLTPPEYWTDIDDKWGKVREECWRWFTNGLKAVGPVDVVIATGDMLDGNGRRSGGTELIVTDRLKQAKMAIECLKQVKTEAIVMVRGTAYHTGDAEDYEDYVADKIGARHIGDHDWYDVNGVIFDVKHHLASSSVPYGDATPLLKEKTWNEIWTRYGEQPPADIILRGHVHSFRAVSGMENGRMKLAMSLPALQGMGSKYGSRRCQKHVDFGFVTITVHEDGSFSWKPYLAVLQTQKAQALKL